MASAVRTYRSHGQEASDFYIDLERQLDQQKEDAGIRYVTFDISRDDLGDQIKRMGELMKVLQDEFHGKKNPRKPHREEWPLYLRVLDAADANIGPTEMAKTLLRGTAEDRPKAASKLKLAEVVRDNFPL